MGWARPSQPGPATGPSQWPGWAQQHACANARVLLHCASELKFTCTVSKTLEIMQKKKSLTWSAGGEGARLLINRPFSCFPCLWVYSSVFCFVWWYSLLQVHSLSVFVFPSGFPCLCFLRLLVLFVFDFQPLLLCCWGFFFLSFCLSLCSLLLFSLPVLFVFPLRRFVPSPPVFVCLLLSVFSLFLPSVRAFFSLASSVSLRRNRGMQVCSSISFFFFLQSPLVLPPVFLCSTPPVIPSVFPPFSSGVHGLSLAFIAREQSRFFKP